MICSSIRTLGRLKVRQDDDKIFLGEMGFESQTNRTVGVTHSVFSVCLVRIWSGTAAIAFFVNFLCPSSQILGYHFDYATAASVQIISNSSFIILPMLYTSSVNKDIISK
jgi:hypothetical protein